MVTDYDCWHDEVEAVSVTNVLEVMKRNTDLAKHAIRNLAQSLQGVERTNSPQAIETCLDFALITSPDARDSKLLEKLDAVAGRAL
jgi:5'-methylthioadenosine phosphorylase